MKKRHILLASAALALAPLSFAQTSGKPVRIVSSFSPGGPVDFVARTVAEQLGRELKRPVIVENKPGANGALGALETLRSEADGSTLWITSVGAAAINPALVPKLSYNTQRDFAPVSLVANNVEFFVVKAKDTANDAAEFIKAKVTKGLHAHGVVRLRQHPAPGADPARRVHRCRVPARPLQGHGAGLHRPDGRAGQRRFCRRSSHHAADQGGRLKAIGIAASKRHPLLPDVKTFAEQGIKAVDTNNWYALFTSAKTSPEVIIQLAHAVHMALIDPVVRSKIVQSGAEPKSSTPEELAALLKTDASKWAQLIKARKITGEE